MYVLKISSQDFKMLLKENGIKLKDLAEIIGIDISYISQIANKRRKISKLCAYAVCKAISTDLEINDLFKNIEK